MPPARHAEPGQAKGPGVNISGAPNTTTTDARPHNRQGTAHAPFCRAQVFTTSWARRRSAMMATSLA